MRDCIAAGTDARIGTRDQDTLGGISTKAATVTGDTRIGGLHVDRSGAIDVQDPLPDGNRHLGQKWGNPVTAAGRSVATAGACRVTSKGQTPRRENPIAPRNNTSIKQQYDRNDGEGE